MPKACKQKENSSQLNKYSTSTIAGIKIALIKLG
jgi:hypothetical protein